MSNDFTNLPGVFETPNYVNPTQQLKGNNNSRRFIERLKNTSPQTWVDIVCCSIIGLSLIIVVCNWQVIMDWLFYQMMFPLLKVLAKILTILAGVLGIGSVIRARLYRHRRWHY